MIGSLDKAEDPVMVYPLGEDRDEALSGLDALQKQTADIITDVQALSHELHFPDLTALYAAVGEGHASARHVIQRLTALLGVVDLADVYSLSNILPASAPDKARGEDYFMDLASDELRELSGPSNATRSFSPFG
jgi:(p)ppGpp synthase/HD superfamily hydrolase